MTNILVETWKKISSEDVAKYGAVAPGVDLNSRPPI